MKNFDSKQQSYPVSEEQTDGLPRKGIALLISLSIFWGLAWPAIKISVSEIPPWTFRTYCLLLSGIGILLLARAKGFKLKLALNELITLCLVAILITTS